MPLQSIDGLTAIIGGMKPKHVVHPLRRTLTGVLAVAVTGFVTQAAAITVTAPQAAASGPATSTAATAPLLPAELTAYAPAWEARGSGVLKFFGFKVYDVSLWVTNAKAPFSYARPFALDIRYATNVAGKDIANTSLIELQRISPSSPEQVTAWSKLMDSLFVDVKAGDRLVGVHLPGVGARFFLNGKLLGESADAAFSEAFFKIWLDPKTKRPELRAALLGS